MFEQFVTATAWQSISNFINWAIPKDFSCSNYIFRPKILNEPIFILRLWWYVNGPKLVRAYSYPDYRVVHAAVCLCGPTNLVHIDSTCPPPSKVRMLSIVPSRACVRILEPRVPSNNLVGIISPLVWIELTDLPNSAGARHPRHPC